VNFWLACACIFFVLCVDEFYRFCSIGNLVVNFSLPVRKKSGLELIELWVSCPNFHPEILRTINASFLWYFSWHVILMMDMKILLLET